MNNLLVAQSGGPTMVINQSLVGVVRAALQYEQIGAVYGARHGVQGIMNKDVIDFRTVPSATLDAIAATPSSALGSVRLKPKKEDCDTILEALCSLGVKWFFYIGGNDSAETTDLINQRAREKGADLVCFHVPKTIDNDLRENDHTPGFGSAARFVASAVMGDNLDNRALGGVKIDVIMGRNAGFLTAASALARIVPGDGPDLIYLPERPFSPDGFVRDVMDCMVRKGRCVIAVSEGIVDENGELIAQKFSQECDSHGNLQLSGSGALGDALASLLREKSEGKIKRVRADTFGYLQRSFPGIASESDSEEARRVGEEAVRAALSGNYSGGSVAIRRKPGTSYEVFYEVVPLKNVAKTTRHMPDEFIAPAGNDITEAFLDYIRPLVGTLPPIAYLD